MVAINDALNSLEARKELLQTIVEMELTDDNINRLIDMIKECRRISVMAMNDAQNLWIEYPTMNDSDLNFKKSIKNQALSAKATEFSNFIVAVMSQKLSQEKFDSICVKINTDEENRSR